MSTAQEENKSAPRGAADAQHAPPPNTFEGKFVSMTGNHLVMANHDGKKYSHTLARDAKVCCDGVACEPAALKVGNRIRVTTLKDDRNMATGIESLNKQAEFA